MKKLFVRHPHLAHETYWQHFKFAVWAGTRMILAGLACITHACFPFLFEHTASNIIVPLADDLAKRVKTVKSPLRIAIIGGGYSGVSLAANIQRLAKFPVHVYLVDAAGQFARGVAFSTQNSEHLLNVRAKEMSAVHSDADHFVNWLKGRYLADQFVPRKVYGEYLQAILNEIGNSDKVKIELINDAAIDVAGHSVLLKSGQSLDVDKVVLAHGHIVPEWRVKSDQSIPVILNPWQFSEYGQIAKESVVLILGTGLTMVDAVLQLKSQQHKGKIYALSRHGLIPVVHENNPAEYHLDESIGAMNLRELCRYVRTEYNRMATENASQQGIFRALRLQANPIWNSLSLREKKQFMRHVSPYWDRQRHRIASEIADVLNEKRASQNLEIFAGRLTEIKQGKAIIKLRHSDFHTEIEVSNIINCTGPGRYSQAKLNPLLDALIAKGIALPNDLELGLHATAEGAIIDKHQQPSDTLFTLGPPLKGLFFESTAVREISEQSSKLSQLLLS